MLAALIRMEWSKLVRFRETGTASVALLAAYLFQMTMTYRWQEASAWDNIVRFPYAAGAACETLLLLLALPSVFIQERQSGTESMLLSTRHGPTLGTTAKLLAALLYTSAVVAGCWLANIGINAAIAGWEGWDRPLTQMPRYAAAHIDLPSWQYVLIQIAVNWLGCAALAMFILWLSVICVSPLTVLFVAGMTAGLPFFIHNTSEWSLPWAIKNMGMMEVLRVENVFSRPRYVNLGSWRLELPPSAYFGYVLLLASLCTLGVFRGVERKRKGGPNPDRYRPRTSDF